jgi:hypothetical protein
VRSQYLVLELYDLSLSRELSSRDLATQGRFSWVPRSPRMSRVRVDSLTASKVHSGAPNSKVAKRNDRLRVQEGEM